MAQWTPVVAHRPSRAALALIAFTAGALGAAQAQTPSGAVALAVDPARSNVWWQIDPHFGHLWATSCPRDPSWQPGEGHSPGYYINYAARPKIKTTHSAELRVPLFPRRTVRPNCSQSVKGMVTMADRARYGGVKGYVVIDPDSITMGADARDVFSRKYVFKTHTYQNIRFSIDSLANVTVSGDTVNAVAHGTFEFRHVERKFPVAIQGVPDPSGLRVRGKFSFPAKDISDVYGVSEVALGAGVGLKLWDTIYLGFDLILVPAPGSGPTPPPGNKP